MRVSSLSCSGEGCNISLGDEDPGGSSWGGGSFTVGAPVFERLTKVHVSSVSSTSSRPLLAELCGICPSWVIPTSHCVSLEGGPSYGIVNVQADEGRRLRLLSRIGGGAGEDVREEVAGCSAVGGCLSLVREVGGPCLPNRRRLGDGEGWGDACESDGSARDIKKEVEEERDVPQVYVRGVPYECRM